MSSLTIEVVATPINTVPTASGKGSYQVIDLAYKNKTFQDKLEGKKVMSFTNKDVFSALQKASFGDVFNVERVKNEKGFWDWTAVHPADGSAVPASASPNPGNTNPATVPMKGTVVPKSNYETSEEREARQVLIVRQSSLSTAVDFANANKIKNENDVLHLAEKFYNFVFQKIVPEVEPSIGENFFDDMEDDLIV